MIATVGLMRPDLAEEIVGVARLGGDLEAGLFEQSGRTLSEKHGVVCDHDSHALRVSTPRERWARGRTRPLRDGHTRQEQSTRRSTKPARSQRGPSSLAISVGSLRVAPPRFISVLSDEWRQGAEAQPAAGLAFAVMEPGIARTRLDPAAGERFVSLRRQLGVTSFGMNQLVLRPGQRGRIHRHARQEEVYLVLEGTLTLLVEGEEHVLSRGELVRIAPDLRRQLVNVGPDRVVVLALGGAGEHDGRDGEAFASWDDHRGAPPQEVPLPEDLPSAAGSG
jgi:quercetin dioxygenase-like cupin family protein